MHEHTHTHSFVHMQVSISQEKKPEIMTGKLGKTEIAFSFSFSAFKFEFDGMFVAWGTHNTLSGDAQTKCYVTLCSERLTLPLVNGIVLININAVFMSLLQFIKNSSKT